MVRIYNIIGRENVSLKVLKYQNTSVIGKLNCVELTTELENIKGVGAVSAEKLQSAGLVCVGDIINYYPRRYDDYSRLTKVSNLDLGKVSLQVRLSQVKARYARRGLHITEAVAQDDSGRVRVVWFNQPYRSKSIRLDKEYLLSGEYAFQAGRLQIVNPSIELTGSVGLHAGRIIPTYSSKNKINSSLVRKVINKLLPFISTLPEILPKQLIINAGLMPYNEALANIHLPSSQKQLKLAQERLGFNELFVVMMAARQLKDNNLKAKALPVKFIAEEAKKFVKHLSFTLTDAQRKCVWQIYKDIGKQEPMNRLIEGDVGSGKTVIAAMAALMVSKAKLQTAIIAPTELLAQQHLQTLTQLLSHSTLKNHLSLLTGSMSQKVKKEIKRRLKNNEISVLVGTHALLQEDVDWHKLGLVVVDEQHRFGVQQRQKLLLKAGHMPHVLCLTATPIPRSLALTVYGELDVSVIDESPSVRAGVDTQIISPNSTNQMYDQIIEQLKAGRQAYIVCPLIQESEVLQAESALEMYKNVSQRQLKEWRTGLLHGRLKAEQKESVMQKFVNHEIDVLVTTTVIEVGVDVPNATVMAIYSADRFGLAQLHQLRGRVGRAQHKGTCYLVMSDSSAPSKRITAIAQTNDGFKLAELDLNLRGPGAIYGTRQHGLLDLKIAQLTDAKLIAKTRQAVNDFINSGENLLKYKQIAAAVKQASKLTHLN